MDLYLLDIDRCPRDRCKANFNHLIEYPLPPGYVEIVIQSQYS